MSIMSWNYLGMSHPETIQLLKEMRRVHFSDILFLMEVKNKKEVVVDYQGWLGYENVFTVDPVGFSGGLAVFGKSCYKFDILHSDKNVIDV